MSPLKLQIPNELPALTPAAEAVVQYLEERNADAGLVFAANLALEELVTNIIKYGYDDRGAHRIDIELEGSGSHFMLKITDDGHEFDPFSIPPPDTTLPLEQRPIGGLGIHFVRNLMDHYAYERREGKNVVTVGKSVKELKS